MTARPLVESVLGEDFFRQKELLTPADLSKHIRKFSKSISLKNRPFKERNAKTSFEDAIDEGDGSEGRSKSDGEDGNEDEGKKIDTFDANDNQEAESIEGLVLDNTNLSFHGMRVREKIDPF